MHTVNFCPGGQPTTYFCRGAKLQASTSDISGGLFGIRSLGCRWLALPLPDKKDITRLPKLDDSSLLSVAHVRIIPSLLQKGMPRILKLASSLQPLFSVYVFFFFFFCRSRYNLRYLCTLLYGQSKPPSLHVVSILGSVERNTGIRHPDLLS